MSTKELEKRLNKIFSLLTEGNKEKINDLKDEILEIVNNPNFKDHVNDVIEMTTDNKRCEKTAVDLVHDYEQKILDDFAITFTMGNVTQITYNEIGHKDLVKSCREDLLSLGKMIKSYGGITLKELRLEESITTRLPILIQKVNVALQTLTQQNRDLTVYYEPVLTVIRAAQNQARVAPNLTSLQLIQTIEGENGSKVSIATTTEIVQDKSVTRIEIETPERQAISQVIEELKSFEEANGNTWMEPIVEELIGTLTEAKKIIQKENNTIIEEAELLREKELVQSSLQNPTAHQHSPQTGHNR